MTELPNTLVQERPSLYNRLVGRHLRGDNTHVWLPICISLPFFATYSFGPLVARRIPRYAAEAAKIRWTVKDNILIPLNVCAPIWLTAYLEVRWWQYKRMKVDSDLVPILASYVLIRDHSRFPMYLPVLLRNEEVNGTTMFWEELRRQLGNVRKDECICLPSEPEEPTSVLERIQMTAAKLWTSSVHLLVVREGLEDVMRRRNISSHDIDMTVLYLTGALEQTKHSGITAFICIACLASNVFISTRTWYLPAVVSAISATVALYNFQHVWFAMHIRNKPAVAAMLRDRLMLDL
ncbi:hypothetical protein DAEQUDRAFT_725366 [Daedalea quercina L-15889]|uniref:Uncharacterized protein n=1 Tax=Daedalea quercina L-15889 TaxID=1314783 RepID=A0A165R8W4_9APHY|nr:hypothetical protein DAEQUDRAFT_725366 [Daedalea quercina L-15889]